MDDTSNKELFSIFSGDTLEYDFTFKDSDGSPINISGMTLYFTMKINKSDINGSPNGLQETITFPSDIASANGDGGIYISSSKTKKLLPDRWYQFDFNLTSGVNTYTIGSGKVFVKQRVRL